MDPSRKGFVRNATDKKQGKSFSLKNAFRCALDGFLYVITTQRNAKIHLAFTVLAIVVGIVLAIPVSSWLAVILCIGLVFAAECVNTAIESLVDGVSPEYSEFARRAKDCAAAAVLVCAFISCIVGIVVFATAIIERFIS